MIEKIIRVPYVGKRIARSIINREGGEKESQFARKIAHTKKVDIDLYSYGSCFSDGFNIGGSVKIGRYCSLGPNIHYFGANHPMEQAVMSPYFYNKTFGFNVEDVHRETLEIGNDVWIGYGTIITSKCHSIGNGSVVGGGTILTGNVPAYAVVVGSPGKVIKYRFDEKTIELLEKSKWWSLTPTELFDFYPLRKEPEEFAKAIIERKRR